MKKIENFSFRISSFSLLHDWLRKLCYRWLTSNALPLFSRGCDSNSFTVNVLGVHEVQVCKILKQFSDNGNSDFLIDIGANIGLTSCQSGNHFDFIIMYEPNPLCVGILQTNTAISLPKNSYEINQFGLGRTTETLTLRVPRNNWGGAYIDCDQNSYDSETMLRKDAFVEKREDNYLTLDVKVKNAEQILKVLFFKLSHEGRLNGAIKIDVEGMELEILYAIANVLPSDMGVSIIFENWSKEFPSGELLSRFGNRASLYILRQYPIGGRKSLVYKVLKLMKLISSQHLRYTLESWDMNNTNNMQGDLVLEISKD